MSKITFEKSSWGAFTAYVDGVKFESKGICLDREDLLEEVLASMGIEVETKWSYYLTETVDGIQRGVRHDKVRSNMAG